MQRRNKSFIRFPSKKVHQEPEEDEDDADESWSEWFSRPKVWLPLGIVACASGIALYTWQRRQALS